MRTKTEKQNEKTIAENKRATLDVHTDSGCVTLVLPLCLDFDTMI